MTGVISILFAASNSILISFFTVCLCVVSTTSNNLLRAKSRFLYQSVLHKWYMFHPRPFSTWSLSLSLSVATLLDEYIFPSHSIPSMYLPGLFASITARSILNPAHPTLLSTLYPFSVRKLYTASSNGSSSVSSCILAP